jgi:hypothetical protein
MGNEFTPGRISAFRHPSGGEIVLVEKLGTVDLNLEGVDAEDGSLSISRQNGPPRFAKRMDAHWIM